MDHCIVSTHIILVHVLLDIVHALDAGNVLEPLLELGVLSLEQGDPLLQGQQSLLCLHFLAACVKELLVGELECLTDGQCDLLGLKFKTLLIMGSLTYMRNYISTISCRWYERCKKESSS